mmetsp:Transcript_22429/g.36006  ORF Transcript_22429/g.36006 Transcript_22429/m.36006 type:complete len:249 (-) Transcript_22429:214-960(-)
MEGEVRGSDLAIDLHWPGCRLQLMQEVPVHKGCGVQPDAINIVGVDHVPDPLQQLLAHKRHALVQVAQVVEPAKVRVLLVVADAIVVPWPAVGEIGRSGSLLAEVARLVPGLVALVVVAVVAAIRVVWRAIITHGEVAQRSRPLPLNRIGPVAILRRVLVEVLRWCNPYCILLMVVAYIVEGLHHGDIRRTVDRPDVIRHDVQDKAHAFLVQGCRQLLEVCLCPKICVDGIPIFCPIACITRSTAAAR